jgi:hypothetical protein
MRLPVGSRERQDTKYGLEHEIVELADKWEKHRETASMASMPHDREVTGNRYHNAAERLARAVRRWRRL